MPDIHHYRWRPDEPSRAQGVYILHGLSEHGGRYEALAAWLTAQGFFVGAHDHPGHGASGGERGRLDPNAGFSAAAAVAIGEFARETASRPILLGHSLGGALAAELVLEHQLPVHGLILSSPALMPRLSAWQSMQLTLMSIIAPDLTIKRPVAGHRLSHDAAQVQAYRSDPLVHGIVSARLIKWLKDSGYQSLRNAGKLSVPTLMLVAGGDLIVDPTGSCNFARAARPGCVKMHWYEDFYHEVFNEDERRRSEVLADLSSWLDDLSPMKLQRAAIATSEHEAQIPG